MSIRVELDQSVELPAKEISEATFNLKENFHPMPFEVFGSHKASIGGSDVAIGPKKDS